MSPSTVNMEISSSGNSTASYGGSDIDARFSSLCKDQFALDERRHSDAIKLFTESKNILLTNASSVGSTTPEELERYMSAFVLYTVKRLGEQSTDGGIKEASHGELTLCQILRAVKLNFVDFFKELPQFLVRLGPALSTMYGIDWEKRLEAKELQANIVHLSCLINHYKRAFQEYFKANEADTKLNVASTSSSSYVSD